MKDKKHNAVFSCLPSPMARVMSSVRFLISATIPAFCNGATRQHNTTSHIVATLKSCKFRKNKQIKWNPDLNASQARIYIHTHLTYLYLFFKFSLKNIDKAGSVDDQSKRNLVGSRISNRILCIRSHC